MADGPRPAGEPVSASCRSRVTAVRLCVSLVFVLNVTCALQFVLWPDRFAPSFELQGVPGQAMVRGIGVLFLMWNATYPLVIWDPERHSVLSSVVLAQQAIALIGETWIWLTLPPSHTSLRATGSRFILFDGLGLVLMSAAFGLLMMCRRRSSRTD